MATTTPSRADTHAVSVEIDGKDTGIWDKFGGGGIDSEETKYNPGGMVEQVSLGGRKTVENVTVSRLYDLDRDHVQVKNWIDRVGKAQVKVIKQHMSKDGLVYGDPLTYTGTLKRVTPPELDSESSDAALIELEITTAGTVA